MAIQEDVYWNSFLPAFFDRMSFQMRKNMTEVVSPYGLTSAHAVYLIALKLQDGQTLVSLSRFLDLDTANTNRVIKVLREKGFVYDDRKTENSKKYFLSDRGRSGARSHRDGLRHGAEQQLFQRHTARGRAPSAQHPHPCPEEHESRHREVHALEVRGSVLHPPSHHSVGQRLCHRVASCA